jgi:hypothetical protein
MVLNLPLDECIDNTQSPIQNLKEKKEEERKEALPSDPKPKNTGKSKDHQRAKVLVP